MIDQCLPVLREGAGRQRHLGRPPPLQRRRRLRERRTCSRTRLRLDRHSCNRWEDGENSERKLERVLDPAAVPGLSRVEVGDPAPAGGRAAPQVVFLQLPSLKEPGKTISTPASSSPPPPAAIYLIPAGARSSRSRPPFLPPCCLRIFHTDSFVHPSRQICTCS